MSNVPAHATSITTAEVTAQPNTGANRKIVAAALYAVANTKADDVIFDPDGEVFITTAAIAEAATLPDGTLVSVPLATPLS